MPGAFALEKNGIMILGDFKFISRQKFPSHLSPEQDPEIFRSISGLHFRSGNLDQIIRTANAIE
jgi:hypothetical protein